MREGVQERERERDGGGRKGVGDVGSQKMTRIGTARASKMHRTCTSDKLRRLLVQVRDPGLQPEAKAGVSE